MNIPLGHGQNGTDGFDQHLSKAADRRRRALAELETCLSEMRKLPDYKSFLLGHTAAEMQASATGGVIVIVNVTCLRSDAILVSQESVTTINLAKMLPSELERWMKKKWIGREVHRPERQQKNEEFREYLI